MSKAKDFAAMDARRTNTSSAAQTALRNRMGSPTAVPLNDLQFNPDNPRDTYDDDETVDLAETLKSVGQLQPALVIAVEQYLEAYPDRREQLGPQPWIVIVGNRRLAASILAGRTALDVRVNRELRTAEAIEDRILIENIQRKDLPPLQEAERLQRRLDRPGQTFRTVGDAIGKSHTYVKQRVDLLRLIGEFQAELRDGNLDIKTARWLGTRSPDEQRQLLAAGPPYRSEPAGTPSPSAADAQSAVNPVNGAAPDAHAAAAVVAPAHGPITGEWPDEAGPPNAAADGELAAALGRVPSGPPPSDQTQNGASAPETAPIADLGAIRATVSQLLGDALRVVDRGLATAPDGGHPLTKVRQDIASALSRLQPEA